MLQKSRRAQKLWHDIDRCVTSFHSMKLDTKVIICTEFERTWHIFKNRLQKKSRHHTARPSAAFHTGKRLDSGWMCWKVGCVARPFLGVGRPCWHLDTLVVGQRLAFCGVDAGCRWFFWPWAGWGCCWVCELHTPWWSRPSGWPDQRPSV